MFQFECGKHSGMNLAEYADTFSLHDNIGPPAINKRSHLFDSSTVYAMPSSRSTASAWAYASEKSAAGWVLDCCKLLCGLEIRHNITGRKDPLRQFAVPVDLEHLKEERQDLRSHNGIFLAYRVHEMQHVRRTGAQQVIGEHPFVCQRKGHHLQVPEAREDRAHLARRPCLPVFLPDGEGRGIWTSKFSYP